MTATARFYTGFFLVLALVVAASFAAGYQVGHAGRGSHAGRAAGTP